MKLFKRLFLIVIVLVLIPVIPAAWYLADLPDTQVLLKENPKETAIRTLREKQAEKKGQKPHSMMMWRSLDQISPNLVHALVLSEDDTFYQHNGFDIEQIKRAAKINWERKRFAFGGSTLTQQLARTLYLSSRKALLRKAKEALITRRLERDLPKKRILELYLNVVEWGPQVYGAEAAAHYFYNKPAIDLTPEQAISLVAILPSPRKWNPLSEKKFMARRKSTLYDRMVREHFIAPVVSSGTETPSPDDQVTPDGDAVPESSADEDDDNADEIDDSAGTVKG